MAGAVAAGVVVDDKRGPGPVQTFESNAMQSLSPEQEREQLQLVLKEELHENQSYFLISAKWFQSWKEYVGLDNEGNTGAHTVSRPHAINTTDLVVGSFSDTDAGEQIDVDADVSSSIQLKPHLLEGIRTAVCACGCGCVWCGCVRS